MQPSEALMRIALGEVWQLRCEYHAIVSSMAVTTESDQTANHAERLAFAQRWLSGSGPRREWALGILSNPTIAALPNPVADATDSDLAFQAASQFTSYALAYKGV